MNIKDLAISAPVGLVLALALAALAPARIAYAVVGVVAVSLVAVGAEQIWKRVMR